jgi:hypothetical protein
MLPLGRCGGGCVDGTVLEEDFLPQFVGLHVSPPPLLLLLLWRMLWLMLWRLLLLLLGLWR